MYLDELKKYHTKALILPNKKSRPRCQASSFNFGGEIIIRIPDFGGYEFFFLCQQRETHSKILGLKSTSALSSLF